MLSVIAASPFPVRHRRATLLIGLALAACAVPAQAQSAGPSPEPAEPAALAAKSLLLDIAAAGDRLVAVGERGHVLLSDDRGARWRQAAHVPARVLLTAVCFADAQRGIAVGHDETIIRTQDGGDTWTLARYAPEAQQPLLDVWCDGTGRAIAVGAYSSYFTSDDGGASWTAREFAPHSLPAESRNTAAAYSDELSADYHLNRIVAASPDRFYIAAEAGRLYRSDDSGVTWIELPSPYEGSFFGVLVLDADAALAYGLRGNAYRSEDAGASWQRVATGTVAMLNDAVHLPGGGIALVGLSGTVLVSHDGGATFTLLQQADRKGISAAHVVAPETLATVGEGGVKLIRLSAQVPK